MRNTTQVENACDCQYTAILLNRKGLRQSCAELSGLGEVSPISKGGQCPRGLPNDADEVRKHWIEGLFAPTESYKTN